MDGRARYRALCEEEPSIPLFSQAWWLDAVAGPEGWNALFSGPPDRPTAWMPYAFDRRFGFRRILMPPLTQQLYVGLRPEHAMKAANRLSFDMEALSALAEQLPRFDLLDYNAHFDLPQALPFRWRGLETHCRWGYVLENLGDSQAVWNAAHERVRRAVRKAEKSLTVDLGFYASELSRLMGQSFERQGFRAAFSAPLVERLVQELKSRNQCVILTARNAEGRPASALLLAWDRRAAYGLVSGFDPAFKELQGPSLLYWHAIRHTAEKLGLSVFDFVGSMHPRIEPARRVWGGTLKPFLQLRQVRHPLLRLHQGLKRSKT